MKRAVSSICAGLLLCVCATFVTLAQQPAKTTAAVPRLVKVSGTLSGSSGQSLNGVVGVTFALYEEEHGGAPLWMETQNVQADGNGRYTAMLGSTRNEGMPAEVFASGQGRWLGVQPQGEPERPRVLMTSVPYALKAVDAETLGGLPASAFALAGTAAAPPGHSATEGAAKSSQPASASTPDLTGTGTANHLAYWTNSTTIGSSALYQTAGKKVGLGTTTPGTQLEVDSPAATAILGNATATSGSFNGVSGQTASPNGNGVSGVNSATSGGNGVYGQISSSNGNGVFGSNTASSGLFAFGVSGSSASTTGSGVNGSNSATSGFAIGVTGSTASPAGPGVYGLNTAGGTGVTGNATAASGSYSGVAGYAASPNGIGVSGQATALSGGVGVSGLSYATSGSSTGVYGQSASTSGTGVNGNAIATSGSTVGVYGSVSSPGGVGVNGLNYATSGGNGVVGQSNATSGYSSGVYGSTASPAGSGVNGVNYSTSGGQGGFFSCQATTALCFGLQAVTTSTGGVGMQGSSPNVAVAGFNQVCGTSGCTLVKGTAGEFVTATGGTVLSGIGGTTQVFYVDASGNGYFAGNLNVTGKVTKGSGSFKIDHPLDPANKYLSHSFVESPDMMDVYNGVIRLNVKGEAWVSLPEYFEALNGDFRYQLTAIGAPAPRLYVAREVAQNRFKIAGGRPGGRVSWQVTGIRHDAYANAHRIPVTEDKPAAEQGTYLHPDAYGQGEGSQIGAGSR